MKAEQTTAPTQDEQPARMRDGAVAMLDILGWKGIWQRMPAAEAIDALQYIEKSVRHVWSLMQDDPKVVGHHRFNLVDLHVQTISDTVVIHAEGKPHPVIELVAGCCATAIGAGLLRGLLIRGAISYGPYSSTEAIFVGPAVDEVASWYDQVEIVGACFTPQAENTALRRALDLKNVARRTKVPVKGQPARDVLCVDWPRIMRLHKDAEQPEAYVLDAMKDVPITPAIALKLDWAMSFARDAQL